LSARAIEELFYHKPPAELYTMAGKLCEAVHGRKVYARGLIEFTNYCRSNCLYCGIRRDNRKVCRYRMDEEQILATVQQGVKLGLQTFVLQGGEDPLWDADRICKIVESIKTQTLNRVAVTLSCGMRSAQEYERMVSAGADRYLLRFETSDPVLHAKLRDGMSLDARLEAIENIRAAGFQVGSGFMTGLPGETARTRLDNILLCKSLRLDMVGIGPFIPHEDTPLRDAEQQSLDYALLGTALLRLALPLAHIPATTAAGSIAAKGRERMLICGANVLMPNITPAELKKAYLLYPGKICLGESGREAIVGLEQTLPEIHRVLSYDRADALRLQSMSHQHPGAAHG
jgi:biotin synthase